MLAGIDMIEKEYLKNYKLLPVVEDQSKLWKYRLEYAVRLGNEYKGKTLIEVNTSEGLKTFETTVWSLTNQHLEIKGGVSIPLNCIAYVGN